MGGRLVSGSVGAEQVQLTANNSRSRACFYRAVGTNHSNEAKTEENEEMTDSRTIMGSCTEKCGAKAS